MVGDPFGLREVASVGWVVGLKLTGLWRMGKALVASPSLGHMMVVAFWLTALVAAMGAMLRVSGWQIRSSLVVSTILGCAIAVTFWPPVLAVFLRPVGFCGGMVCNGRFVCFDGLSGMTFFLPALWVGVDGFERGASQWWQGLRLAYVC